MDKTQFVHSHADEHFWLFQFLAIVDKAAIDISVQSVCGPMLSFFSGECLEMESLAHMVLCLTFLKTGKLFSEGFVQFYILTVSI